MRNHRRPSLRSPRIGKQALSIVLFFLLTACASGVPKSSSMPIGALTLAPRGFIGFCDRDAADCQPNQDKTPVQLTETRWRALNDVNVAINHKIKPETDEDLYHVAEYWTYADAGAGDCEDYALTKKRALIQQGWPVGSLLLATARNENGEMHAVLIASTDHGDFVLDNANDFVTPWSEVRYRWVARQDRNVALAWHRAGTAAAETGTAALH